jgi:hypothetical protein
MQSIDVSKISVKYRNENSYNCYSVSDLKSGLQKYIRRGNFEKAMYCAWELYLFSLVEGGQRIITNFIHRLMIIVLEDICDINLLNKVWELIEKILKSLKCLKISERNICFENNLKDIVKIMCDSVKSRENSYYRCIYITCPANILSEYPEVSDKIENYIKSENEYKMILNDEDNEVNMLCYNFLKLFREKESLCILYGHRICELQTNKKYYNKKRGKFLLMYLIEKELTHNEFYLNTGKILYKMLNELDGLKEDFLCWQSLILYLLKNQLKSEVNVNKINNENTQIEYNLNNNKIVFDEYVFDMHTLKGKKQKKSHVYFSDVSSFVENEDPNINKIYKEIYKKAKYFQESGKYFVSENKVEEKYENNKLKLVDFNELVIPDHEKDLNIITRAQLVTSYSKTDTYFIKINYKNYFVKGPFKDITGPEITIKLTEIKKELGLNYVNSKIVYMFPDGLESGLSIRNKLDKNKKYPFVVSECLFQDNELPMKEKESKMWKKTMVLDFEKLKSCRYVNFNNEDEFKQMLKVLIFRAILGIPDICQRNFAYSNNNVYSLDEEQINYYPFTIKFTNDMNNKIKKEIIKDEYSLIYKEYIEKLEKMNVCKIFGRKIEIKNEDNLLKLFGII